MTARAKRRALALALASTTSMLLVACGAFGTTADDAPNANAAEAGDSAITSADADAAPSSEGGKEDAVATGPDRHIFTTAGAYTAPGIPAGAGGASGVAAADAICTNFAKQSNNPLIKGRPFKAWLGSAAAPAKSRIAQTENRSIRRSDGQLVASSWSAFANASHPIALDKNQDGQTLADSLPVWTNSDVDGAFLPGSSDNDSCTNWSDAKGNAIVGDPRATTQAKQWTRAENRECNQAAHFYCIED